jgi:hypothetical protein
MLRVENVALRLPARRWRGIGLEVGEKEALVFFRESESVSLLASRRCLSFQITEFSSEPQLEE